MPATDQQLLRATQRGDLEAFDALMHRYERLVYRLVASFADDSEGALDLVQEVFLKAYRSAASYRPSGRVYTWLYRIATNHCLNRLRRRKIVRFFGFGDLTPEDDETSWDPADSGPDAEQRFAARRAWQRTG